MAIEGHHDHTVCRVDLRTGEVVERDPDQPDPAALAAEARVQRDHRLSACDWVVLRAAERGETVPETWINYRQALRDWPGTDGFPDITTLPQQPA